MSDFLTREERDFLQKHRIDLDDVLDARGLSVEQRKTQARAADKTFIVGVPCQKARHRLRTRAGHCIQCDTSKITFQRRDAKSGYVYIAGSRKAQLIKVGSCGSLTGREQALRNEQYAGADDWRVLRRVSADERGKLEFEVHRRLEQWSVVVPYAKGGQDQGAREAFACGFKLATAVLDQAVAALGLPPTLEGIAHEAAQYEFPSQPKLQF